jgi:hypothetical protein
MHTFLGGSGKFSGIFKGLGSLGGYLMSLGTIVLRGVGAL